MPEYKLLYFDARGRVEIGRLMFAAAGQNYEDIRYNKETWPAAKGSFHGKTLLECLQVNMILGTAGDLQQCIFKALGEKDDKTKAEMFKKLKAEDIPNSLKIFEKFLTEAGNDYFCLDRMTLADLMVFVTLDKPVEDNPSFLDKFPKVKANMTKVKNNPGIKACLAKRPKIEF